MDLVAQVPEAYLAASDIVDWRHPAIRDLAAAVRRTSPDDEGYAASAFEYVRDQILHSWDAQDARVTVSASEVLREGASLCFGKSHLLVALLRAQDLPAGLCYQRLRNEDGSFCVHGLVAVFLRSGWHRHAGALPYGTPGAALSRGLRN